MRITADWGFHPNSMQITFRFDHTGMLRMETVWNLSTSKPLKDLACGLLWKFAKQEKQKITIPHMIYNNNPSAAPDVVVPHLDCENNKGFICEEHRLPIPCVNIEWKQAEGFRYFTVFSIPPKGSEEQEWSLGGMYMNDSLAVTSMSGVVMFNGEKDMIYGRQKQAVCYDSGYLNMDSNIRLKKEYVLDWGELSREGKGFQQIAGKALDIFQPSANAVLAINDVIALKTEAMDGRWVQEGTIAGYRHVLPDNESGNVFGAKPLFLEGWAGKNLRLAWCNAKLGFVRDEERRIQKTEQAVNFFLNHSLASTSGLRFGTYHIEDGVWTGTPGRKSKMVSSRMFGESITDLGDIILLFQQVTRQIPQGWIEGLEQSARFLMEESSKIGEGIYPIHWDEMGNPLSNLQAAAGIPCVRGLIKTYQCTNRTVYLYEAEKILQLYADITVRTMECPFARSTLDAKCEDKEAGIFFFLAALDLLRLTGKKIYREWAEMAADWIATFMYVWDPGFTRGSTLSEKQFNATGWTGVSVQNHHLDVYFPSWEMWEFGRITDQGKYKEIGELTFKAFTHGIATRPGDWGFPIPGEQGEQFMQTNFSQGHCTKADWRGGYNPWNPSWIIENVLEAALNFRQSEDNGSKGMDI